MSNNDFAIEIINSELYAIKALIRKQNRESGNDIEYWRGIECKLSKSIQILEEIEYQEMLTLRTKRKQDEMELDLQATTR